MAHPPTVTSCRIASPPEQQCGDQLDRTEQHFLAADPPEEFAVAIAHHQFVHAGQSRSRAVQKPRGQLQIGWLSWRAAASSCCWLWVRYSAA